MQKIRKAYYPAIAIAGVLFFSLIPYTCDDWAWGSVTGMMRLRRWFSDYNGRYLGNLLELALTRNRLIKTGVMSLVLTGILFVQNRIHKDLPEFRVISLMAVIFMPITMFRQTMAWVAGFANYTAGAFLMLLYIEEAYRILDRERPEAVPVGKWRCAADVLLPLCGCLFVENLSIYFLLMSVGLLVYTAGKKRPWIPSGCLAAGSAIGCFLMFSNSGYALVAGENSGYRAIGDQNSFWTIARDNFLDYLSGDMLLVNVVLNFCIVVCVFLILKKSFGEEMSGAKKWALCISGILIAIGTGFGGYVYAAKLLGRSFPALLAGIVTVLFALSILCFSVIVFGRTDRLPCVLFLIFGVTASAAPLLAARPISYRCFLFSYFMCVLYVGELLRYVLPLEAALVKKLLVFCKAACILLFCAFLGIYGSIAWKNHEREASISRQIREDADEIVIRHLPLEAFLVRATPEEDQTSAEKWQTHFKDFYGIERDKKLRIK